MDRCSPPCSSTTPTPIDTTYFAGGTKIDDRIHNMSCGGPAANDKTSLDFVYARDYPRPRRCARQRRARCSLPRSGEASRRQRRRQRLRVLVVQEQDRRVQRQRIVHRRAHRRRPVHRRPFTNGGGASNIQVFRWNGNDITGSLGATPIVDGQRLRRGGDQRPAVAQSRTTARSHPVRGVRRRRWRRTRSSRQAST